MTLDGSHSLGQFLLKLSWTCLNLVISIRMRTSSSGDTQPVIHVWSLTEAFKCHSQISSFRTQRLCFQFLLDNQQDTFNLQSDQTRVTNDQFSFSWWIIEFNIFGNILTKRHLDGLMSCHDLHDKRTPVLTLVVVCHQEC